MITNFIPVLYLLFVFVILMLMGINVYISIHKFYQEQCYLKDLVLNSSEDLLNIQFNNQLINILIKHKSWYILVYCIDVDYIYTNQQNIILNYIYQKMKFNILCKKYNALKS